MWLFNQGYAPEYDSRIDVWNMWPLAACALMNRGGDGVAARDRKVARSNIPVKGGWFLAALPVFVFPL